MAKQEYKTTQTQVRSTVGEGNQLEHILTVDDNCLPAPSDLAKYQEIYPEIIPFLIETTKKEQEFRHEIELKKIKTYNRIGRRNSRLDFCGMLFAAIVMLAGIGLSALLIYYEKIIVGSVFGGSTIIVSAIAFIRRPKFDEAEMVNTKRRK